MPSFGVGPNPYKPVKPVTADALTQEKWNYWIKAMTLNEPWQQAQSASYQAAQNPNHSGINTQNPIPFPGVWQGGEQPAIISPFVDWDKKTYVVTHYHYGMETTTTEAVFTNRDEAQKFIDAQPLYEDEYNKQGEWNIDELTIDAEVLNEPKE